MASETNCIARGESFVAIGFACEVDCRGGRKGSDVAQAVDKLWVAVGR
jgi:hypothetical protein